VSRRGPQRAVRRLEAQGSVRPPRVVLKHPEFLVGTRCAQVLMRLLTNSTTGLRVKETNRGESECNASRERLRW
jgi:hypothetical protein